MPFAAAKKILASSSERARELRVGGALARAGAPSLLAECLTQSLVEYPDGGSCEAIGELCRVERLDVGGCEFRELGAAQDR